MKSSPITRFFVALVLGTTTLVALAQQPLLPPTPVPPPWWPTTAGPAVVDEWYSDLPWHQKLGTYAGNQIDEPIVMPYAALPPDDQKYCNAEAAKPNAEAAWKKNKQAKCMLEVGVTNVLGMKRIDTPYAKAGAIKDAPECQDPDLPCTEVMIRVANFYAKSGGGKVALAPRIFGDGVCRDDPWNPPPEGGCVYDKGYTISDGTTYAPQMPWYMSHYCDAMFNSGDFNDPTCYGDYLSTFNSGFNAWVNGVGDGTSTYWPRTVPWSVWPVQPDLSSGKPTGHVCKEGETVCNIVLAGFDLKPLPPAYTRDLQYYDNNDLLLKWFNNALKNFSVDQGDDYQHHFPWSGKTVTWDDFYPQSAENPFLGTFAFAVPPGQGTGGNGIVDCYTTLTGPQTQEGKPCAGQTLIVRASQSLYPRQCDLTDLVDGDAAVLRKCGLNYELHHNGWGTQWPPTADWQETIVKTTMNTNQYGRTSFLFAGVPGMQLPVSFYREPVVDTIVDPNIDKRYSIYEQVYNTSIFSMYLPMVNESDTLRQMLGRHYQDDFYHTLLMSNHNESDPDTFAEGIRGKTLWHNEYRTHYMYQMDFQRSWPDSFKDPKGPFPTHSFNAAFTVPATPDPANPLLPFHNNTCDGCHVRNGSGVPIKLDGTLDPLLQEHMTAGAYRPNVNNDYTFTGVIRAMKLVFFDLQRSVAPATSKYSTPLAFTPLTLLQPARATPSSALYYNNAIMNYYGDSFHVAASDNKYNWDYQPATPESQVVPASVKRKNPETGKDYVPMRVVVREFQTNGNCQIFSPGPAGRPWPKTCADVSGDAVAKAIKTQQVGYMLLNGRRLGNSSAIEAMPDSAIKQFRDDQINGTNGTNGAGQLGPEMAGELIWTAGSRDGVLKECKDNNRYTDCFVGRFGWLGDRASLEDQVANAAFVEMNMTSTEGFKKFYPDGKTTKPIRYATPNCGPANNLCKTADGQPREGNSDLTELDIKRMAEYSRWVGNPTRSEFQVTLPEVIAGERVFRELQCNTCHVIDKISLDPLVSNGKVNTMLPETYRKRLEKRAGNNFLSYLGTDLLMHDMGYLSQVGIVPEGVTIRDASGVVYPAYQTYVQKIRTPALKGMRFNRYVTESYQNTKKPYNPQPTEPNDPACDFLLHDGRACDAVEAAFLHDGPAVNKLDLITKLNQLSEDKVRALRAFLYSL